MSEVVSVHSYRGGTGKSNITANLAYLCAMRGKKVAVIDTDLQSPGVHVIFGLERDRIVHTMSEYLTGQCEIERAAYDMSRELELPVDGRLFLLPSSMKLETIMRILTQGYDVERLNASFNVLVDALDLDYLFLDTHPGLNQETMLTTAVSDTLIIPIRPDYQDYHGTAVLVEVAGRLGIRRIFMLANKIASRMNPDEVKQKIQDAYGYEVVGTLPLCEDMVCTASHCLFTRSSPGHAFSLELTRVAERLLEPTSNGG